MVNTGPMMAQRLMAGNFTGTEGQPGGLAGHFAAAMPAAPVKPLAPMPQAPLGSGSLAWMNGMGMGAGPQSFGAPVAVYHPPAAADPAGPAGPVNDPSFFSSGGGA